MRLSEFLSALLPEIKKFKPQVEIRKDSDGIPLGFVFANGVQIGINFGYHDVKQRRFNVTGSSKFTKSLKGFNDYKGWPSAGIGIDQPLTKIAKAIFTRVYEPAVDLNDKVLEQLQREREYDNQLLAQHEAILAVFKSDIKFWESKNAWQEHAEIKAGKRHIRLTISCNYYDVKEIGVVSLEQLEQLVGLFEAWDSSTTGRD
jgi:hypothetical protein